MFYMYVTGKLWELMSVVDILPGKLGDHDLFSLS